MELFAQLPVLGNLAWTLIAFVAALSVIVFVHEYGHYIVGRLSGIKADVFSLGFGPKLVGWTDKHGTHWQIAALPFGGYVKFKGDANAASGKDIEVMAALPAGAGRDTMHGAPLWARTATVAAGPAFNFIFSGLIFATIALTTGVATNEARIGDLKTIPGAEVLHKGDLVTAVGGQPVEDLATFFAIADTLPPAQSVEWTVEREGRIQSLNGPFPFPAVADMVQPDSAAQAAGMQDGDVITAIDGTPVYAFSQLRQIVGVSEGKTLTLDIWRDGQTLQLQLTPRRVDMPKAEGGFETRWLIGLSGGLAFTPETRATGIAEAAWLGVTQTGAVIKTSLSGMWHMVTGAISSCNLRGPIGIAESSGNAAAQGGKTFIWFIAMLSTAVGMMNLFPVPVLDGGHLVFYAYEAVAGKPPSDRALQILMSIGMSLLMGLMVFALTRDLFCP